MSDNVSIQASVDWQSNYDEMLRQADDIEQAISRLSAPINLDLAVDTSRLAELDTLTDDQTMTVNVDPLVEGDADLTSLLSLDSEVLTPQVDPDVEADADLSSLLDLDSEVLSPTVDPEVSADGDAILDKLNALIGLEVVNLVVNLAENLESAPVLGRLFSDQAAGRIATASTAGQLDPAAAQQAIDNIFNRNYGENLDEVARLVSTISNVLGETDPYALEEIATNAYEAATAISGITGEQQDVNALFVQQNRMVESGLADNFQQASDIMVAGFQSAIGYSGDFLGDLGEFTPVMAQMGFTAEQTLSTLESGLSGGVDNISRMAESFISFNGLASTADENFTNSLNTLDQLSTIDLAGQFDLYQQGQLSGADLMAGVLDAAREYADTNGVNETQGILSGLFGSTAENIGAQGLLNIDPNADGFSDLENRAKEASDTIRDTLQNAITEFMRTAEDAAADFLSEDQLGLADKIAAIQDGLTEAIDVLQEGGTLGEALEVGFQIKGVDEFIHQFQSAMGNFVIAILQVVATLQDLIPGGATGDATRAQIATMAEAQLAFDLEGSTADNIVSTLTTAIQRGVDEAAVGQALSDQIAAMVQNGDIGGARELLAQFGEGNAANLDVSALSAQVDSLAQGVLTQFHTALAGGDVDMASALAQSLGDTETLNQAFDAAFGAGRLDLAGPIAEQLNDPTALAMVQHAFQQLRDDALSALESGDTQSFLDTAALAPDDDAIQQIAQDNASALTAAFDEAIANQDTDTAQAIADLLDDSALQTRVDDLKASVEQAAADVGTGAESMAAAVEDADGRIGTATTGNTITTNLEAVGTAGGTMGKAMQAGALTAANAIDMLDDRLEGSVASILARLATLRTAMADAQNVGSGMGGGPQIDQNYTGGVADGWSWVGERGPELMHFDQSAAILNNQSSMRMLDLMGGGMGGSTINQYNTWNVNSGATADAAVTRILNQLRGLTR